MEKIRKEGMTKEKSELQNIFEETRMLTASQQKKNIENSKT